MPRALSASADQVRRFDYDRFICILFAPPQEREALFALHAFNVEVARIRELVTQPMLGLVRLQWWREALDGIYAGRPPRHQTALALTDAVRRFALSRHHFDHLLDARARDMEEGAPADLTALIDYADGTSATLSRLSLEILAANGDRHAEEAAGNVGVAWALTGLLRAVPFHARGRRVYLPAALNRAAELNVLDLFELRATPALSVVVEEVADSAGRYLDAARAAHRRVPRAALPAMLPATVADDHLRRLRRVQFDPFALPPARIGPGVLTRVGLNAARGRY